MGAMKRMARFFSGNGALSRENPSNTQVITAKRNRFDPPTPGTNRTETIKETEWREAPWKYQKLMQQGRTIRVVDERENIVIILGSTSAGNDEKAEKEMQDLLDSCPAGRMTLSGSWLD
jgi:hypothetical protein